VKTPEYLACKIRAMKRNTIVPDVWNEGIRCLLLADWLLSEYSCYPDMCEM